MVGVTERLLDYVMKVDFDDLPEKVIRESKRLLLDSIGVAIAGVKTDKGINAIKLARKYGGPAEAGIIGTDIRVGCGAAAFANAELITAMDYEPFGGISNHYPPFLLPSCLAIGETMNASGKDMVLSIAVGGELSIRLPRAIRGTKRFFTSEEGSEVGKIVGTKMPVSVLSTPIVTGAIAAGMIKKLDRQQMANLVGIASFFYPVPQTNRWEMPVWPLIKWGSGGASMGEVTAVLMAEIGYTADHEPLDGDLGLWRFHGGDMWDPGALLDHLGLEWTFPEALEYKPYPVFRPTHIALDCFKKIIEDNNLNTEDIDKVTVKTHPNVAKNYNKSKTFPHNVATQSSIPYVIAVTANRMPCNNWQNPTTYRDPDILNFMEKVFVEPHPDFARMSLDWTKKQGSTISSVEVVAKGKTFKEQGEYARGCPHQEWTRMTDQDLVDKFKENTADRLPGDKMDRAIKNIMELENLRSIQDVIRDVTT